MWECTVWAQVRVLSGKQTAWLRSKMLRRCSCTVYGNTQLPSSNTPESECSWINETSMTTTASNSYKLLRIIKCAIKRYPKPCHDHLDILKSTIFRLNILESDLILSNLCEYNSFDSEGESKSNTDWMLDPWSASEYVLCWCSWMRDRHYTIPTQQKGLLQVEA